MEESKEIVNGVIQADYALEAGDIKSALHLSGRLKDRVGLHVFQSCLALLGLAIFISSIFANPTNVLNYVLAAACLILLGTVWLYPYMVQRQAVKTAVDGKTIHIELQPGRLRVAIPDKGMDDTFSLGDMPPVKKNDDIFLLEPEAGIMLIIPIRRLPEGSLPAAAAILEKAGQETEEETEQP